MKLTGNGHNPAAIRTPENDRFEELRALFSDGLQADRVRLTALAASLARAADDPAAIFESMRVFAHKLRGAAAIFDFPQLGVAAGGLESAAVLALQQRTICAAASLGAALEVLIGVLGTSQGGRRDG
jgi:Hpt domain